MSDTEDRRKAWDAYWLGHRTGCLPQSSSSLDALFRSHWHGVAQTLPKGARVLDLATGAGSVLKWLGEVRDDLDRVGIDLAQTLPSPPSGCRLIGGVAMEDLPFADAEFDAVVSQFGFEYGSMAPTAASVARVVRGGGMLALVTHHADGPIVTHNRKRAAGIAWAIGDAKLLEHARKIVGGAADPSLHQLLARAPRDAIAGFGRGSAAWEIAEAVRRTAVQATSLSRARALASIDLIERKARGEVERIAALEAAARAMSEPDRLKASMEAHSIGYVETHPLLHGTDRLTVADAWQFRRS